MRSVLVVDDDLDMQLVLRIGLEADGFRVIVAADGPAAIEMLDSVNPDLVIIDVNLGLESFDGFELCRRLRRFSEVAIVFLSVRGDDIDQLIGIAIGADDYLVKPISPRLLSARVNMALSHAQHTNGAETLLFDGDLHIDTLARVVTVNGVPVELTRIEFEILALMATAPEHVMSRDQITARVWGDWFGSDAHLDVHMSRLRKKILDAGGPRVGKSVRGIGFRLG